MSKELETFYRFRANVKFDNQSEYYLSTHYIDDSGTIETALKKQEQDQKKLKALEIIKEKLLYIDFKLLLSSTDYETYCFMIGNKKLTEEEYDLLKEVLL